MVDVRRSPEWAKARALAFRLSDGICYLCGGSLDFSVRKGPAKPEVDHRVSLKLGGDPLAQENLSVVHKICNQKKGAKLLTGSDPAVCTPFNPPNDISSESKKAEWSSPTGVNWLAGTIGERDA